jgi:DNA-binding transcriptional LysR family regulator
MDVYQLRTFVTVAREGSITRTAELLHLSQPAVSAHIKAIEDALSLSLFSRTARGMILTVEGERLLAKAEQTLAAHQELVEEASRIKGRLTGKLRLGAGGNANSAVLGGLVARLTKDCPEVKVAVKQGTSAEVLAGIRNGSLDAGFYNEAGDPDPVLEVQEVSQFRIHVVAPRGRGLGPEALDWSVLGDLPWVYPAASACCGRAAETLFKLKQIRPKQIISVDREDVTRTLIASGVGVGLLHTETALAAQSRGEIDLLFESPTLVRVLFAQLASRAQDPLLQAASSFIRGVVSL